MSKKYFFYSRCQIFDSVCHVRFNKFLLYEKSEIKKLQLSLFQSTKIICGTEKKK